MIFLLYVPWTNQVVLLPKPKPFVSDWQFQSFRFEDVLANKWITTYHLPYTASLANVSSMSFWCYRLFETLRMKLRSALHPRLRMSWTGSLETYAVMSPHKEMPFIRLLGYHSKQQLTSEEINALFNPFLKLLLMCFWREMPSVSTTVPEVSSYDWTVTVSRSFLPNSYQSCGFFLC